MIEFYPIFFALVAVLASAFHCIWLHNFSLVAVPDYAARSQCRWPINVGFFLWCAFLCLDLFHSHRVLFSLDLSAAEILEGYALAGGIAIAHLHTGFFLIDTRRSLRFNLKDCRPNKDFSCNLNTLPGPTFSGPEVALLIPSCNEPAEVVRKTLAGATQQTYRPTRVILVENSSDRTAKLSALSVAKEVGAEVIDLPFLGSKAAALNCALERVEVPFVAILDSDQVPSPQFVAEVLPYLRRDSDVAFVQLPQMYRNTSGNVFSLAAAAQQYPFYQYLLPGRSRLNGIYCVGTNVMFNRRHLLRVGGFDDHTVTEDIATSLLLHRAGYRSIFIPMYLVKGLGPADFGGYLIQQRRWAQGTFQLLWTLLNPRFSFTGGLRLSQWLRYVAGILYYLTGFSTVIFLVLPVFISANITENELARISRDPIFLTLPLRFIFYSYLVIFAIGIETKAVRWLWLGGILTVSASVAFVDGAIKALFSRHRYFEITPKHHASKSPTKKSLKSATIFILLVIWSGNVISGVRVSAMLSSSRESMGIVIILAWALVNCVSVSGIFLFGFPRSRR